VKDQLKLIYDSFSSMTSTKLLGDQYDFEITKLNQRNSETLTIRKDLER
jgi:hypothetical protein